MTDPGELVRAATTLEATADQLWTLAQQAADLGAAGLAGRYAAEARTYAVEAAAARTLALAFDPDEPIDQEDTPQ